MSTFIEVRPEENADTKTTYARIDDDLKITTRTEKGATHTDYQFNYTGVDVGIDITTSEPVEYVRVTKIGDDVRATIGLKCYYLPGEASTVPAAGTYWYNPSTHYNPELPAEMGKTAAANPTFEGTTQTFPTIIFNTATDDSTIATTNTATAPTIPRLYARLGSLEARRAYLKRKLLAIVDSQEFLFTLWGRDKGLTTSTGTADRAIDVINYMRTIQVFVRWYKLLALTLSIDVCLNTERKFNLINGQLDLNPEDIKVGLEETFIHVPPINLAVITGWRFEGFGTVAATEPWAFSHTGNTYTFLNHQGVIGFNAASLSSRLRANNGAEWLNWLRE